VLPTTRGRLVTVTPSASSWLRAAHQPRPRRRRSVLAAGPGLEHAEVEVGDIARLTPSPQVLTGAAATAVAVGEALDGASLAHMACHGHFRADNPSFSYLELTDGALYVYDLERLRRPPHVIVLSACDAGRAAVSVGDELRGLTAALLACGTQAIIASVLPVPDVATRALMVELHTGLAAGASPAAALALAQEQTLRPDDPGSVVASAAFTCFGAGWAVA
jgi:CHAT domain-containing protein